MTNQPSTLIGADPEFFLKDVASGDKPYGAHHFLDRFGDKENPIPCPDGATQVDGLAMEFNILPAATKEEFAARIRNVMGQIRDNLPPNIICDISPTVVFDFEDFEEFPFEAKMLGCEPDFDAYRDSRPNEINELAIWEPMRTAAGHVHVGSPYLADADQRILEAFVKELDAVLYPMSFYWDDDQTRRTMYGKPGSYRPKPYGLEYRVLSNRWLASPELMEYVFQITEMVVDNMREGYSVVDKYGSEIETLTNDPDYRDKYCKQCLAAEFEYPLPPMVSN
jgi:hypothetical protein